MPGKILCVAEKNSISKAVAEHLSGGHFQTVSAALYPEKWLRPKLKLHPGKYWQPIHQELLIHV